MIDRYKQSMDKITMSDELKKKIMQNASAYRNKKLKRAMYIRRASGIAACLCVLTVSFAAIRYYSALDQQPDAIVLPASATASPIPRTQETPQATAAATAVPTANDKQPHALTPAVPTPVVTAIPMPTAIPQNSVGNQNIRNSYEVNVSLPEKPSRADSPRENIPPRTTAPTSRPVEEPTFTQAPVQTVVPIPDDTPPEQSDGMMGGSPLLDFDSVAELEQTTGFAIPQLSLPTGYELSSITLVGGTIAQLRYTDSAAEVIYRMEKGTDDCSGDYNSYETTEQIPGKNGELKGTGGLYFTAVWSDGEYAYAVSVPEGTTREALIQMIDAV